MTIDAQLLEQLDAEDKKLEALKETDPVKYARQTEPTAKLRRRLEQVRTASRK